MQRLRVKFGKGEAASFLSHLDMMRLWERALRRSGLPLAYSRGFNPHPMLAMGSALAVGVIGLGEYLDCWLETSINPDQAGSLIEQQLPIGIKLLAIREAPDDAPALMAIINRAGYRIQLEIVEPIDRLDLQQQVDRILAADQLIVQREKAGKVSEVNLAGSIYQLDAATQAGQLNVECCVQTGSQGNVRPQEVLACLLGLESIQNGDRLTRIWRTGLWVAIDGLLKDPLDCVRNQESGIRNKE